MTRDQVKARIKKQFGTYSKFTDLAGIDRYVFQRDFLHSKNVTKDEVARINGILSSLTDQEITLPQIASKLKSLKTAIKEFGGVRVFCAHFPEFKPGSVNGALQNRQGYTKAAIALIKHFKL